MSRALGPFFAAFALAMLGCWGLFELVRGETFPAGPTRLPMLYVLPPLAGLALFQLLFGGLTGLWRGARFWVTALAIVAPVWASGLALVLDARLSPLAGLGLVLALLALAGLIALRRTRQGVPG